MATTLIAPRAPRPPEVDDLPSRPAARPLRWPRVVPAIPPLALAALFAARWHDGWLLLLDASPGPRSAPWSGPELPVGVILRGIVGAVAAVDPQLVGWVVPATAVLASYAGGHRLARCWHGPTGTGISSLAAVVGGCVAAANPFVASRLYAGQIGVLWGYAAMWWLAAAVLRALDDPRRRAWVAPGIWLALATGATVHMAIIGVVPIVAGGIVHARRRGGREATVRAGLAVVLGTAVTCTWLVPLIVSRSLSEAGGDGAAHAFASGGPVSTLWLRALGGAAFWRPLPDGSLTGFGVLVAVAWLGTALAWRHGGGHSRGTRHVLVGCGIVAAIAVSLGHGPLAGAWGWAVANLWPAGLLREPGKLLVLALLAPACGAAVAVQRVLDRRRAVGLALVGVATLAATGAWAGFTDRLAPSAYPTEWAAARATADADDCPIVVLGDGAYTNPGFTGGRVVAQPARGFLGPRAVVSNDPEMAGLEPRAPRTPAERWAIDHDRRYLHDDGPAPTASGAAAASVGWVFVDRPVDRPGIGDDLRAGGFEPTFESDRADMWRVPGGCA